MPKNIVLCLDGTGNQVRAKGNTNVMELVGMLAKGDPTEQVVFYDAGVGTFSSAAAWTPVARWLSRQWGLIAGGGLKQNVTEAYEFVMQTYEPGDRIYVFGFSRGAFTARALAGLIYCIGIFRPGAENVVPYAVASYMRRNTDWKQLDRFRDNFSRKVSGPHTSVKHGPRFALQFLGLFDTVKAAGFLRWRAQWPYTHKLANVVTVRHAVSIDEKRRPYREYLAVAEPHAHPAPVIDEVWFAGVHSDVGGTFEEAPKLSKISLKWMAEAAWHAGVRFRPRVYADLCRELTNADCEVHTMGWFWIFLTYRKRKLEPGYKFHGSVQEHAARLGKRLPPHPAYVDPGWRQQKTT